MSAALDRVRAFSDRFKLVPVLLTLALVAGAGFITVQAWRWTHPAEQPLDPQTVKTFGDANNAYARNDYGGAIRAYEVLARDVDNEELYYNLGNAYFGAGASDPAGEGLGRAVYWYERALAIDPTWTEARENLSRARAFVKASLKEDELIGSVTDPWYVRVAGRFTIEQLTLAFILSYLVVFGLLLALRYMAQSLLRTSLGVVTVFVIIGAMLVGGLFANKVYVLERLRFAITLPARLPLRRGPMDDAAAEHHVHAGQKVRVLGVDAEDWAKIRLANGYSAYVKGNELGMLE